jgi:hypothetical protein
MCGDIAVLLIPSLLRRSGKSRRVASHGASGRFKHPLFFEGRQARIGLLPFLQPN